MGKKEVSEVPKRFIRATDAPGFFSVDRNRFNKEIRPRLTEIALGPQTILFDVRELHAVADEIFQILGTPPRKKGWSEWVGKNRQGCLKEVVSGTSTSKCLVSEFDAALEQISSKKQKDT